MQKCRASAALAPDGYACSVQEASYQAFCKLETVSPFERTQQKGFRQIQNLTQVVLLAVIAVYT